MTELNPRIAAWLQALETRHLADLTLSEAARALRALSSCYVERRDKLATGGALESAGKRAAFALFYAPLHYFVVRDVVQSIPDAASGVTAITDLGCGTGAAGVAWALTAVDASVLGIDRHPWAIAEAIWTYRQLGIHGRAVQRDAAQARIDARAGTAVLAGYTLNELQPAVRDSLFDRLLESHARGARVLIVEPIARRATPWWRSWEEAFTSRGGRSDEWRFPMTLPRFQQKLARAAGLDPREMTARSLYLP